MNLQFPIFPDTPIRICRSGSRSRYRDNFSRHLRKEAAIGIPIEASGQTFRNWKFFSCKPGFIALISILIIDAIALLIGVGLVLRAVGENKISLSATFKQRTETAANACAEHALNHLKDTTLYTGQELLSVGTDNCYIMAVTGLGNSDRTVQTTSTVSGYTSKIKIQITKINPVMIISSWENVTNF